MGERAKILYPSYSDRVCIVLVEPAIDGNIGAVARSMLNFGFTDLRVVGREGDWSEETRNRAKNAQNILESARQSASLDEAVDDCSLVIGTSGKREHGDKIAFRHFLLPDELPNRLDDTSGLIALVFGTEGKGLSTEDLHLCDFLCTVPTWEGYPILNLSHAVTLVCSSWFVNEISNVSRGELEKLSSVETVRILSPELRRQFRDDVRRLSQAVPVPENKRNGIEETLTRVILRGMPKDDEISRILGVINKATQAFEEE